MGQTPDPLPPPGRHLLLLEPRGLLDIPALIASAPFLLRARRGKRHGVIVLPGFGADDGSTALLRRYLSMLGYDAQGWKRGFNVRKPGADMDAVIGQIRQLKALHHLPVSLIGWSRGGIMAREIARKVPDDIRLVITLGSPFADASANNVGAMWTLLTGEKAPRDPARLKALAEPIPAPATAIYTRADGVVAWQACLEKPGPRSENIEVRSTHIGLGFHAPAFWAIADRLAQPFDQWTPFKPTGLVSALFPTRRQVTK